MDSTHHIGRYVAERALGAGSFATVWLGYDELLDARVAIKVLADNWSRNTDVRRRFIEEAKILRRIDHDRIVRVHSIDELPDGRPYIVMALADRGTLHERLDSLRTGPPMPIDAALRMAVEICEALAVVHDFGVVHRDIKPSNVLFRSIRTHERIAAQRRGRTVSDEEVMLGDFGLAKDLAAASGFTLAAGTPAYMAPEQAQASSVIDRRVDVFAATAVLYELVSGHTAFSSDTLSGVRRSRSGAGPRPIHELRPDAPEHLQLVIDRGLALRPEDRLASATELADALELLIAGQHPFPRVSAPATVLGSTVHATPRVPDVTLADRALMPPPSGQPSGLGPPVATPSATEPTGAAGRLNDLVAAARHVPGAASGEALLARAQQRLVRPLSVAIVPIRDAVRETCARLSQAVPTEAVMVQVTVDIREIIEADIFVLVGDDTLDAAAVDAWVTRLQPSREGPLAIGLIVDGSATDLEIVSRLLRGSKVGSAVAQMARPDMGEATLRMICHELTGQRLSVLQASAALHPLVAGLDAMPPSPSRAAVHEAVEGLRSDLPVLEEIDLLRDLAAGRAVVPLWLRGPLHSLLLFTDAARRLRLPPEATPAEMKAAVIALGSDWRTQENSGRLPFSARRAALVAQRSLDRLYAELAPYG